MHVSLDQLIEYSVKAEGILGFVYPPGVPVAGAGIAVLKFIAGQINAQAPSDQPVIELPSDEELINRMEATADRIVSAGQSFDESGG